MAEAIARLQLEISVPGELIALIAAVKLRVRAVDAGEVLHVCSDKVEALDAAIVVVAEDKLTAVAHDVVAQGLEPQECIWRFLLHLVAKASDMLPKPFFLPTDAGVHAEHDAVQARRCDVRFRHHLQMLLLLRREVPHDDHLTGDGAFDHRGQARLARVRVT